MVALSSINRSLTGSIPTIAKPVPRGWRQTIPVIQGCRMDIAVLEQLLSRTPATLDQITVRISRALERHPLCRGIRFEVVETPRRTNGGNWTVSLHAFNPDAISEASEIVADIQDAYDLAA
jgi:hypothetical protein